MNAFPRLIYFLLFITIFSLTELSAATIRTDNFTNGDNNGWKGSNAQNDGWLYIDHDKTGYKPYNLGSAYANQLIKIEFYAQVPVAWEASGQYEDFFNVLINNTIVKTYKSGGGYFNGTIYANTDNAGKIKISFNPNTTSGDEYAAIDFVRLSTINLLVPPVITPATYEISRNSPTGIVLGTLNAEPVPDTFRIISGNDEKIFALDNSGNLTIANGTNLSNSSKMAYILNVAANNSYGQGDPVDIIVYIKKDFTKSNARDFTLYRKDNIQGNIKVIGNSVKLDSANGGQCAPNGTNNNALTAKYADMDNDKTTFNSTSASLVLPVGVKSKDILYASLYWQGRVNSSNNNILGATVKIKPYGQSSYKTIVSLDSKFNWRNRDYQGMADITNIIKESVNDRNTTAGYNEPIWIANVYSPENSNGFGVWSIVVVYADKNDVLKNISTFDGYKHVYNDTVPTPLSGFLTPTTGVVNSNFYVFAGEGDITLKDSVTLTDKNGASKSLGSNIFQSAIDFDSVKISNRNPSCQNTIGADIRGFSVGTNGTIPIIGNSQTSTIIKLTSNGDEYIPGFFALSTQLYEPRVCYYIDTIVDSSGADIFKDAAFVPGKKINSGEDYTFNFFISNMKKNPTDTDIEIAKKVQIYLNMTNFNYAANTTNMRNIGKSVFSKVTDQNTTYPTDTIKDDLGEYLSNRSTWRVGNGASPSAGGTLDIASDFFDTSNIARINLKASLTTTKDAKTINLLNFIEFRASFQTDTITIGKSDAQLIEQCQDLNSSGSVASPPAGAFNVVSGGFPDLYTYDPSDPNDINYKSYNSLPTQVSAKDFGVEVLALGADNETLKNYTGKVYVSIIQTPNYVDGDTNGNQILCNNAVAISTTSIVTFDNEAIKKVGIKNMKLAIKNASFRIIHTSDILTKSTCSRDVFAIRPDRFILSTPIGQNINTLASGVNFKFPLIAAQYSTTNSTSNYTVNNAQSIFPNIDNDKTTYLRTGAAAPINGILAFSANNFNILNGSSSDLELNFNDVGRVRIELRDTSWAAVDKSDTPQDCSATGAYICGSVTATFIPDHFTFVTPLITNDNGTNNPGDFTYLSNAIPANPIPFTMAARINTRIEARNVTQGITTNFTTGGNMYENPIAISVAVNNAIHGVANVTQITAANGGLALGFTQGFYNITWNSIDITRMLRFNFNRIANKPMNPFQVTPAEVTLSAISIYGATNVINDTSGNGNFINRNATFIYGRTNAPRQRFVGANGTAFIYFEAYCNGFDTNGQVCNKALLPNGVPSTTNDDPRWFIDTNHVNATMGIAGAVTQKGAGYVTAAVVPNGYPTSTTALNYDTSRGYPYKATMQNAASPWLIYDQYNIKAQNEFQVEFTNNVHNWAGQDSTNNDTGVKGTNRTNRRSMW